MGSPLLSDASRCELINLSCASHHDKLLIRPAKHPCAAAQLLPRELLEIQWLDGVSIDRDVGDPAAQDHDDFAGE
jgi:hypothetical protein